MSHQLITEAKFSWSHASQAFSAVKLLHNNGRFIKGPIPLGWISQAAFLPGKAVHVALALLYLAGLQKSTTVKLGNKVLDGLGVARGAKHTALNRLQQAGLVSVQQVPGRAPIVTILLQKLQSGERS